MSRRLPRGVEALLGLVVPGKLLDSIVGDLEEDHARRSGTAGWGATAVTFWQAFRITCAFAWERAVRKRRLRPVADHGRASGAMLDSIRQDFAFALRLLRRQPGFAMVAVLALALGIGANTAIFSIVDAVLWRPLPFSNPETILSLAEKRPREGRLHGPVSPADFYDWRREATSFSEMAAYGGITLNLTGGAEPQRLHGTRVTNGFLRVLGMKPALGRDFEPEEDSPGRDQEVLLSDGLWRRLFGADRGIVGRKVTLDDEPYEVVGVLPSVFWWPTNPEFLTPYALTDHDRALRAAHFLEVVGRLRPGASESQAGEELAVLGRRLSAQYPAENANHAPAIRPLRAALVGDTRTALLVLLWAVAFVLLIACANVATLLLARASRRQKELALRFAMGAGRGRVARQFLIESLVLAVAGGGAGLLVAGWAMAAFPSLLPAQFEQLPGIAGVGVDARVLAWTVGVSLATGLVFGSVPALIASDLRIGEVLAEETRGGVGPARGARVRSILVASELALSVVLLVGAVLLMASFRHLMEVAPGFRAEQLVTAELKLSASRYGTHARVTAFYASLFEQLQATPGVVRAAATSMPPFSGLDARLDLQIEHRPDPSEGQVRAHPRLVSTNYFATMGIPLLRGRSFDPHDDGAARDVVVLNQAAAKRYWPEEDPIGQRIRIGGQESWMTIVGIVGDVRHVGLDAELEPEAFIPLAQGFDQLGTALERSLTLVVRTRPGAGSPDALLRSSVASVDPQQPVGTIRPMETLIAQSVAPQRLNYLLLGAFAIVAVVLTAAGLYGVMVYVVGQRTREIGVRMALGASGRQVAWLVLGEAGVMMLLGIAVGIAASLALARSLTSLLFGISAGDPTVYLAVSAMLLAVGLAAAGVPCRRAMRIDPLTALRHD